jgi:AcrR family transcriptional regulator
MTASTRTRAGAVPKAKERLTRERVIEAAMRLMDTEGLDSVSMRRVAREVGVEAMSLYHHVRDKDDLLDGICAQVMHEFRFPNEDRPWVEVARDGAREWRRVLKAHPNVMTLWADRQRPLDDVRALMPMEFALRVIHRIGVSDREAVQIFNVLGGYIMGVVIMETGGLFSAGTATGADRFELGGTAGDDPASLVPADLLPCIAASMPHLAECDPDEQFEFGLDLLLAGIEARLHAP